MARSGSLKRYQQMRDFTKTPEPKGAPGKKQEYRYLIQKHAATRLHYDFRLELDGVLKSWAVTKGPSLDPHDKRLAVEVEDHPLEYGSFEGIIPKGQYGGGTVMLWDQGTWEPTSDPHDGLKKGKLEFRLHGKRLSGEWTLVRMRSRKKDRGRNNWLLIKRTDNAAEEGNEDRLLEKNKTSVVSGRTMEKIAAAEDAVWKSNKSETKPSAKKRSKKTAHKLPAFKPPQLATLSSAMPQGKNWVHEIKFDGYRALAYLKDGKATIYTRTGQNWTRKFPTLASALSHVPADTAILDGEIVGIGESGTSSFKALQNALSEGKDEALQYYVFDLLHLDAKDLTRKPLLERKALLEPLLQEKKLHGYVFYSEHFVAKDEKMLAQVCGQQLEGIISKRADAAYSHGRGKLWLKTKCHKRQEFVIGGYTLPKRGDRGIGALLLGYYEEEELNYAGKVGTGFDNETSLNIRKKLEALGQKTMPFVKVQADGKRGAKWVKPELVCEVEFTEWTSEGRLRHPSFQGLREDKPAMAISRDEPVVSPPNKSSSSQKTKSSSRKDGKTTVGSIAISHPERVVYPGTDITKLDVAKYYDTIADYILPHVKQRPLSMIRCPEGTGDECFFQRHIGRGQLEHIYNTGIKVKGRSKSYVMIKDHEGLVTLAQWGVIELHPWGCLADKPQQPDRIIFDLDPGPSVPWRQVMEAAREVRERMEEFGLESFVKTTGGKGLHVTIPMTRGYEWPTVKSFARAIAESMQHDDPKRYIAKSTKAARKGKIFVDYLRNDLTSTSVAPFSLRARKGAPVAMTLAWDDLTPSLKPEKFTLESVPVFLKKRKKDPWADFFKVRQKIAISHLRALKIEPK